MLRLFDRLNLSPSERRLLVIILTAVVVVLNYWLIWPRFGDLRALSDRMESVDQKRDRYEREIARRPQYEAALNKLQAEGTTLPAGEERIQFRTDMERLARDVGLTVPRWSEVLPERSSGTTSNAFFEAISLTLSQVGGTEAQFVEFLYRVGASNSTIRVKELNLAPGNIDPRAQGSTNLVGTLKLVASIQKSPPPGQPAATAPSRTPASPIAARRTPTTAATGNSAPPAVSTITNRSLVPGSHSRATNTFPIPVRVVGGTNHAGRRPGSNRTRP